MIKVPAQKVAVEPIFDPDKIGSIYIPSSAKERCDQGIVKYVGSKVKWLEVGDYVLFSGYSGTLVNLEGEGRLIILPEAFVIAKIYPSDFPVSGLYFKDKSDGTYFPATYEEIFYLIAKAVEESDWKTKWGIKLSKRKEMKPDTDYSLEHDDEDEEC